MDTAQTERMEKSPLIWAFALLTSIVYCSPEAQSDAIPATKASEYIGQTKSVVGTVTEVHQATQSNGKPTYLNFERAYPNHPFSAVIFEGGLHLFKHAPRSFEGNRVRVTGTIVSYKGKPQIVVKSPEQIQFLDGSENSPKVPTVAAGSMELLCNNPLAFQSPASSTTSKIGLPLLVQINQAKTSIDFAIYGIRKQPAILTALLEAVKRGVRVRGVVDNDIKAENYYSDTEAFMRSLGTVKSDYAVDLQTSQIPDDYDLEPFWPAPPGFKGPAQCLGYSLPGDLAIIAVHASREPIEFEGDIMHNKFFVIDAETVWTGSCNLSDSGSGGYNANVAALIHSPSVASWYTAEFEQMYVAGKFHRTKTELARGTQLETKLSDGTAITAYFSPQGYAMEEGVQPVLQRAQKQIDVAIFFLTHKYLTADLIKAHQRGVRVRVIADATGAKNEYTKIEILRAAGIPVKVENWGGKMHAKAAVVDGETLVMGSMNWTSAGERTNDENTLIVRSPKVASQFTAYFEDLWQSIDDRWLTNNPDPESKDSGTSWRDGIDNDFDNLVDEADPGTGENPPPLPLLPPFQIVAKEEGHQLIKGAIINGKSVYFLPNHPKYDTIKIQTSRGEQWFPSIWEAREAGWNAARK